MCFERFKYVISYSEQLTSLVNPMFFVNLTLGKASKHLVKQQCYGGARQPIEVAPDLDCDLLQLHIGEHVQGLG